MFKTFARFVRNILLFIAALIIAILVLIGVAVYQDYDEAYDACSDDPNCQIVVNN